MTPLRQIDTIIIFTDAATSPQAMISVGAFLCVNQRQIDQWTKHPAEDLTATLADAIVYREYQSKKSTWSEIKTAIDALHTILKNSGANHKVEIYTDCKSLCDLLGRRKENLINNHFITKSGKVLQHADLYKELFALTEKFQISIFKIKGHASTSNRLTVYEKIFTVLDKLSRKKLRCILHNLSNKDTPLA